jgi:hypothetical protein
MLVLGAWIVSGAKESDPPYRHAADRQESDKEQEATKRRTCNEETIHGRRGIDDRGCDSPKLREPESSRFREEPLLQVEQEPAKFSFVE